MPPAREPSSRKLRNLRLIASKRTFLIFIVGPTISFAWLLFAFTYGLRLIMPTSMPYKVLGPLIMAYPLCTLLVQVQEGEAIAARLSEAGYRQVWDTAGVLDLSLDCAIIVAIYYWIINLKGSDDDDDNPNLIYVMLFLSYVLLVGGSCLVSLGPVIWFTTEAQRDLT
ncbi:uncharacterized protein RCC_05007 [Ramularia collo-cygni]|uniref:Uncharacterized protein n=1 Tax=Ramularia collo-cygni TaxID=112498 RepID=A0A2D3USD9_9PEZI|nr:uncharacterized protein RCC_05007 [Ramularia collo-cygni]CZT19161.1 uncharacterized protein RCC_05007 [Ramularia collo-cygni]